nr:retrovirus-related Pol polyprotein from transposon TNT 1-94 [Tanacetum cinerariifolium]
MRLKNKSLAPATPLSTAFFSTSIVQDFQDSPDVEENTRSSHEYLNDLEDEYQARAILAKSKRFFKNGLIAEDNEWDKEEGSSDNNEMVEVKVLKALAEENDAFIREGVKNDEWRIPGVDQLTKDPSSLGLKDLVFVKYSPNDTKVTIPGVERPWLSKAKGFILPNHDTSRILPTESQRNITDSSVAVTDSSATDYDSADKSLVCSIPLPPLKKLDGAKPVSGPKTLKSTLRSKSIFKAEALKDVTINELSSAPAKGNKSSSASKVHSAPTAPIEGNKSSLASKVHSAPTDKLKIISLERKINQRNPQHVFKKCKACGSPNHTTTDHYDIEWFKRECEKGMHHRASFKTKQTSSTKKCLHLLHMDLFGPITPRSINHEKYTLVIVDEYSRSTIVKRHLKTPYEIFLKRIPNITFLYVFGCLVYIHNDKDHLRKFDERADDGYILRYSLISKAFRVFNTRRKQTEETYHIIFDESPNAIKFSQSLVDNINMAKTKRYLPDEYLHPYEPSQMYQTNSNDVSFIEPYESPKLVVLKTKVSFDQNGQADQNDQSVLNDEILNDGHSEHSNHTNGEQIIDNLLNTKDIQIFKHLSSLSIEDTSVHNTIPILIPPRTKKVYEALKHPGWVDAMQEELNQFARNKVWTLVPVPYEPYGSPKLVVLKTKVSFDQNGQADQNDQSVLNDEILNDGHSEHSNHTNGEQIIDNLPNTKDIQISKPLSSPSIEDTSVHNTIPILIPPLPITSMVAQAPQDRWSKDKHIKLVNIIGNPGARMLTRAMSKELSVASAHECLFVDFLSEEELKRNKVRTLVPAPYGKIIIGSKWVFMNKRDKTGIVIKNKARLIAQGYNQQEVIDYDETFALVARLKAIRIFLAFAIYMNFIVYEIDVKSALLNGKIKEEVYVKQPPGFESSTFPNHVCKLEKALYGVKQAPRAWYETLSAFLTEHKFVRGNIDNTLFIYKTQTDVILVQIYVDDIIFGSTSTKLCKQFAKLMTQRYEISMIGMIGSLMYLTASRPDIQFSTCLYARYQVNPKESHLTVVKRIFRYLKGTPSLGLWYPKCSGFDLKGYLDSDYDGCNMRGKTPQVPQGKKPRAATRLRSKRSSKHTSKSRTEASKSQTGQSKIKTQSSSAKDNSPSHPSPPTPMVGEMHKEAQQAVGGLTSLRATSKERAHPQLSSDSTAKADPGPSAPNDSIPPQQSTSKELGADEISKKVKLEDLADLLKDTRSAFFTPDSPPDEPINVLDESDQEESQKKELEQLKAAAKAKVASLKAKPLYPDINQLTTLLELPVEILDLPYLISSVQETLKNLDSILCLLNKVTNTLNRFATMVENASEATTVDIPSAGKVTASPAEGEKNTKDADTNLKNELVDLLGIDVVRQYYNKKVLYERYCEKMKKRRQSSKIINCDVLTKKVPISLKIYIGKIGQLKSLKISMQVTYVWLNGER